MDAASWIGTYLDNLSALAAVQLVDKCWIPAWPRNRHRNSNQFLFLADIWGRSVRLDGEGSEEEERVAACAWRRERPGACLPIVQVWEEVPAV
jgi:hypothetical protein